MEKFIEALGNLEKSFSHFEKVSDNYLNNLSATIERKAQDLELRNELAKKIDRIHRQMKKMGLLDEVKAH